jgi:aspartate/methionine/tyrosine aminotransferase
LGNGVRPSISIAEASFAAKADASDLGAAARFSARSEPAEQAGSAATSATSATLARARSIARYRSIRLRQPMHFSARARVDLTPNRLSRLAQQRRGAGARIVDLTESNPTAVGLVCPPELLLALGDPAGADYAPATFGLPAAREAVAADYRRRGFPIDAERVVLTASSSEAYAFLFKLLLDPGDAVMVPRPSYPLFEHLLRLENGRAIPYDLAYDGEWHISIDALERRLPERARAVVVVNPNNPTGSFVKGDEGLALRRLVAARGLALVSDEVFADYAFAADPRRVASFATDDEALSFSLGGLSKACGLPQLKLGWIAVTGPAAARADALRLLELIADAFLSVGTPVQLAAPRLLARLPELQAPIQARVRRNLELIAQRAHGSPATLLRVEGGWYAILKVPRTLAEEERVLRLLERHDVLVHPGYFFDFPTEAYLVLSLLPPPEDFARGVETILAELGAVL